MPNVVLVADMVRGFCEEGRSLYVGPAIREIIPRIRELLEREKAAGSRIIFVCDTHEPNDKEFEMFPPHCVRGSIECEVIAELRDIPGELMPKNRYSAFVKTPLEQRLAELKPETLTICGVCTDICVLHTAADARNRDYPVEVPADCVATFDPEAHRWALKHIQEILGAKVVSSAIEEESKA